MSPAAGASAARPDGSLPLWLFLAPWFLVVAAGLKLKRVLLVAEGGGFDFVAELTGVGSGEMLPLLDRLSLYREDILLPGIVGSILYLGILRAVRPAMRPLTAGAICLFFFLLLYLELKAFWEVGTFISADMIVAGMLGAGRGLVGEYLASATLRKLAAAVTVLVLLAVALDLMRRSTWVAGAAQRVRVVAPLLAAASAAVVAGGLTLQPPPTPYSVSAMRGALLAFFGQSRTTTHARFELDDVAPDSLVRLYARLTNAPVPNQPSQWFGKARGYDVIVFLYESLPWACVEQDVDDSAFRNLQSLSARGFRADAHYSTYPYSRKAYLSIYASWYPGNTIRGTFVEMGRLSRELTAPGLVRSAAAAGYETAAFVPEEPLAADEDALRYAALGFTRHEVPRSAYQRPDFPVDSGEGRREWHRIRDGESFDSLKASVVRAIAADRRYLYAYNPQVSHGPWPGVTSQHDAGETCRAGLGVFQEVDAKLGELIRLLKEQGRLDRTLIVALGDHGLRTRTEYPPFRAGTLQDVTFHVPLSLWAPGVVDSTVSISGITSHIDIAPSILDLLGITEGRERELGSPFWEPGIAGRKTFFFAREYLGADGYYDAPEAVMLRYLYGGVSRARWEGGLRFRLQDLLQRSDTSANRVAYDLNLLSALQHRLARTILPGDLLVQEAPGTYRASARP